MHNQPRDTYTKLGTPRNCELFVRSTKKAHNIKLDQNHVPNRSQSSNHSQQFKGVEPLEDTLRQGGKAVSTKVPFFFADVDEAGRVQGPRIFVLSNTATFETRSGHQSTSDPRNR